MSIHRFAFLLLGLASLSVACAPRGSTSGSDTEPGTGGCSQPGMSGPPAAPAQACADVSDCDQPQRACWYAAAPDCDDGPVSVCTAYAHPRCESGACVWRFAECSATDASCP